MKRLMISAVALLSVATTAFAQYPDLTSEASKKIAALKKQWAEHSDSAWEKAFPIVIEEAKAGRPYVPWASRLRPAPGKDSRIPWC